MNTKQIVTGVVALVVAIVITVACAIPVISDSTKTEDTFTNTGYFYVDAVVDDESITYDYEDHSLKVNDVPVDLPTGSQYPDGLTIIYTEHICIRYDGGDLKVRGVTSHSISAMNITVTEGNITGTYAWTTSPETTRDIAWTYEEFVGMVPDATNRVMCKSEPQYLNSDSHIETTGLTKLTNINQTYVVHISGSIDDGITVNFYSSSDGSEITTVTAENITTNTVEVSGYDDLYKLNSITFTATDGEHTDDVTYTIYTIPVEVTAERTYHPDSTLSTMINVIPVLLIVSIIIGAVALFISNRRD